MTPDGSSSGVGASVRRREDLRLLRGHGEYSDDLNLPGQLHAAMVRSPHAHARLKSVETVPAQGVSGARRAELRTASTADLQRREHAQHAPDLGSWD